MQNIIGYSFNNRSFLKLSLIHKSYSNINNEKLEFLGDSILGLSISNALFSLFPFTNEGNLSRMKSVLIQKSTLSSIARNIGLQKFLYLGRNEVFFFGRRESFLSNSIEALIGSIYLDSDIESVERIILLWYKNYLYNIKPSEKNKDSKSRLQEYLQKHYLKPPKYISYFIPDKYEFYIECKFGKGKSMITTGISYNKKNAEQISAYGALKIIKALKK
ncbi:ribonuclease III [Candidatus Annandia pinicola]|uniref:ribonuclease III n=1 Tax=Candidatus Annandia pinicola TaxID=1345117 RepID=UPI001D01AC85|nr:ribonuclease III [Candidatus Annandia pinicola]UDG80322.1 Ribonuclease 3 [Candidatus Annandia pinicola]